MERWRRIAVEAAEQCGRSRVPGIGAPLALDDAIADGNGLLLLPYESAGAHASTIRQALDGYGDALMAEPFVSIYIGPEGGFEEAEVEHARATVVTMGPRVLRSETAGLVALALVLQATGDLG
jgi:16S rRNA (uracil1498-N3)-methyltransferase